MRAMHGVSIGTPPPVAQHSTASYRTPAMSAPRRMLRSVLESSSVLVQRDHSALSDNHAPPPLPHCTQEVRNAWHEDEHALGDWVSVCSHGRAAFGAPSSNIVLADPLDVCVPGGRRPSMQGAAPPTPCSQ